jgi:Uma2 family endonuclease
MKPARRRATYEDLCKVPDHLVAEILDGDLYTSPRPAVPHALAASKIHGDLESSFGEPAGGSRPGPGGFWILFEPELHLGPDVLVPDLAAWRRERLPELTDIPYFTLAPDWVCEGVSPSTAGIDRVRKLRICARESVAHLWLVDPVLRTLEVYRLEGGRWVVASTHAGDDAARAEPFDAVDLALARWWLPEAGVAGGGVPPPPAPSP